MAGICRTGVEERTAIIDALFQKDDELAALLFKRHAQRSNPALIAFRESMNGKAEPS